jgi:hypothetical protein
VSVLNESISIADIDTGIKNAFVCGRMTRRLLPAGTELYKFTDRTISLSSERISPWWSAVEPIAPGDTGLEELCIRSQRLNVLPKDFARARSAVTKQWNSLSQLVLIHLSIPVFCFVGRCSAQKIDNEAAHLRNVVYIGGAWQIYLPNLNRNHLQVL